MADFTRVSLDDDASVLLVLPSSGEEVYIVEHDPACEGYDELLDSFLDGWPEIAEVAEDSPARTARLELWVGSEALGNDLNSIASDLAGYDIYGAVFVTASGGVRALSSPLTWAHVRGLLQPFSARVLPL